MQALFFDNIHSKFLQSLINYLSLTFRRKYSLSKMLKDYEYSPEHLKY